jgi:hypothetical protein
MAATAAAHLRQSVWIFSLGEESVMSWFSMLVMLFMKAHPAPLPARGDLPGKR